MGKTIEEAASQLAARRDVDTMGRTQERRVYRIGELAEATQSTARTLRYYEELNLLKPIRNTAGQRLYDYSAIERLNFINELKSGGFSLNEIKAFFESWNGSATGEEAAGAVLPMIRQKMSEISDLQKKLTRLNDELQGMLEIVLTCQTCKEKPGIENCLNVCEKGVSNDQPSILKNLLK